MNGKICVLFLIICECVCDKNKNEVVSLEFEDSGEEKIFSESFSGTNYVEEIHERDISEPDYNVEDDASQWLNGTLHKTAKRYHCSLADNDYVKQDETLLIYGNKAWSFPRQDVNLTLFYPMDNANNDNDGNDYLITQFEVILFIDNTKSRGFINYGGLKKDSIGVSFIMQNISILGYEFKIHGVRKSGIVDEIPLNTINMCT